MSQLDFVVKVGGGAITNKKSLETTRPEVIRKVSDVLARCYRAGMRFIVAHGAGWVPRIIVAVLEREQVFH